MLPGNDGSMILAGAMDSFGNGSFDGWLSRLDKDGDTLWERTYGYGSFDSISSVARTRDGGYILAGQYGFTEGKGMGLSDAYLVKTDAGGMTQWESLIGGQGMDTANSVCQTSDGGYVFTGYTEPGAADFTRAMDLFLVRTDDRGEYLWKKIGGASMDTGNGVIQAHDGGFVVGGTTESDGNGRKDVYLVKTDDNGSIKWNRTFGGKFDDTCNAILQASDGGYILVGSTQADADTT